MDAASHDGHDPTATSPRRWNAGRLLIVGVVVALVGFWIYAFSGLARRDHPDTLDDPAFAAAAEPQCADAVDAITKLPPRSATASERATTLDEATGILEQLVGDLRADAPDTTSRDGKLVSAWLADWETYLDDRRAFADELRDDPEARFLVTARAGRQVTEPIEAFASVNDMASCATPGDA